MRSAKQKDPRAPTAEPSHRPGDGGARRFPAAVLNKIKSKSQGKKFQVCGLTLRRRVEYSGLC